MKRTLSPRQRQVLERISYGMSHREIAEELGCSPSTVEKHLRTIERKLEVKGIAQLTRAQVRLEMEEEEGC